MRPTLSEQCIKRYTYSHSSIANTSVMLAADVCHLYCVHNLTVHMCVQCAVTHASVHVYSFNLCID